MNTFIPKTSGPGRRCSVWADRRLLLPETTIEPGRIIFHLQSVGPDVGEVLPYVPMFCSYRVVLIHTRFL